MLRIDRYTWVFIGIAFAFFLLKVVNIAPKISDENIYFYDAYLISKGILPYRDFFLASLPGQLIPLAVLIKLFGFNLFILKLVPILASIGSASLLYRMVSREVGGLLGIIAATLFLFSFSVLVTTDHGTGVHEATFFLTLSWYFLGGRPKAISSRGRNAVWAGLSLCAALAIRTYIIPAAIGFALFLIYQRRFKRLFIYGLASAIPYLALNGILYLLFKEKFYLPVWQYHLLKSEGIDKAKILTFFLSNEWMLLLGFVVALVFVFNSRKFRAPNSILVGMASFGLLAQCAFLAIYKDLYYLYLVALIPFFAVLAASAINRVMTTKNTHNTKTGKRLAWIKYLSVAGAVYVLINGYNYQTNHAPASVIDKLGQIVADVEGLTETGDTVWGTFAVAPLVALDAGLDVKDNQVDSNVKRILTGLWTAGEATNTAVGSTIFIQLGLIDSSSQNISSGQAQNVLGPLPVQNTNQPLFDSSTNTINGKVLKLDPDYVSQHVVQDNCKLLRVYPIARDYDNNAVLLWRCGQ
jgi:hypothetical protein